MIAAPPPLRFLDTDVCIDILRGRAEAVAWFTALPALPVVPGPVAMELVQGCRNNADLRAVNRFLRPLMLVWPSEVDQINAFDHYRAFYLPHNIGLLDCLIAFTAVGRGAVLCTFNVRHFRTVAVLTTEQPYIRP